MKSSDVVVRAITRCGGIADAGTVIRLTSRHAVSDAVQRRVIVRDARGRYSLPTAEAGMRTANRLSAVVSHTRGWLSFHAALAIADSALRHRAVTRAELVSAHDSFRGHGRRHLLRVIEAADGRAANPFESVLRAIALDVPGLQLLPQVEIRTPGRRLVRPDLVDERLKIALEADSFEHHGSRKALVLDCVRYDNLVADGWTLLRFAWEHVMYRPAWVRSTLMAVTDQLIAAGA